MSEKNRSTMIGFRVSEDEQKAVDELARRLDRSPSDAIRQAIKIALAVTQPGESQETAR